MPGWRWGALAVLAAALWAIRQVDLTPKYMSLPLEELRVPEGRTRAERLPLAPGSLAGANLLLVTLDTTRPDRLGLYGNDAIETPTLDRLAAEGVVFTRARAVAPTTLPTHASILTGLRPHRHGARANGVYRLSADADTLAERLAGRGYETAAFVSALVLHSRYGLAQGFDTYDERFSGLGSTAGGPERPADRTTRAAKRWLAAPRERPFFAWVHYFDPHADYHPPAPWSERYAENRYDGEIAFVDAQLGALLDGIPEDRRRDTLIVVLGDHGEAFGHRGEHTHGYLLHEAVLRIPFLMVHPERLPAGVVVDRPVSQVDVLPTLLSLLGAPLPAGLDGVDLTAPIDAERPLVAGNLHGLVSHGFAPQLAVVVDEHAYVYGPRPEFYDFADDPLGERNVLGADPAREAALLAALREVVGEDLDAALVPGAPREIGELEREQLRALGYVLDADTEARRRRLLPDPKDVVPVMFEVEWTASVTEAPESAWLRWLFWLRGRPTPLTTPLRIARLESLAREHPDFVPIHAYLAEFRREAGALEEALAAIRRAVELAPGAPEYQLLHGELLAETGRDREARAVLSALVANNPEIEGARLALGELLMRQRAYGLALEHLREAQRLDPGDARIAAALGEAESAVGPHRAR